MSEKHSKGYLRFIRMAGMAVISASVVVVGGRLLDSRPVAQKPTTPFSSFRERLDITLPGPESPGFAVALHKQVCNQKMLAAKRYESKAMTRVIAFCDAAAQMLPHDFASLKEAEQQALRLQHEDEFARAAKDIIGPNARVRLHMDGYYGFASVGYSLRDQSNRPMP